MPSSLKPVDGVSQSFKPFLSVETGTQDQPSLSKSSLLDSGDRVESQTETIERETKSQKVDTNWGDGVTKLKNRKQALTNSKKILMQLLLCNSNYRLSSAHLRLRHLQTRLKESMRAKEILSDSDFQFKNRVQTLKKRLNQERGFEASQLDRKRGQKCLVCNTSDCVYEEDVLIYCDMCSVMVHQLCAGVDSADLGDSPWFCTTCQFRRDNQALVAELKCVFASGTKSRGASRKALQNLDSLIEEVDTKCVMCGRLGGVFFPVDGVQGEFCHASCAFWLDELSISIKSKKVIFLSEEDARQRTHKANVDPHELFLNKKCRQIGTFLANFFEKKKHFGKVEQLQNKLISVLSGDCEEETQAHVIKSTRKRKQLKKQLFRMGNTGERNCVCLFHSDYVSFIKKRILFLIGTYLHKSGFNSSKTGAGGRAEFHRKNSQKWMSQTLNLLNSSSFFNQILKNSFWEETTRNANCEHCRCTRGSECRICGQAKGLSVKCYEDACEHVLHVECARRVDCELGFPLKDLSNDLVHSVFCDVHSKSPGQRTRENFRKIKEKEISNAEKKIKAKWGKLLGKRKKVEMNDLENVDQNRRRQEEKVKEKFPKTRLFIRKRKNSQFGFSIMNKSPENPNWATFGPSKLDQSLLKKKTITWELSLNNKNKRERAKQPESSERAEKERTHEKDSQLSFIRQKSRRESTRGIRGEEPRSPEKKFSLKRIRLNHF